MKYLSKTLVITGFLLFATCFFQELMAQSMSYIVVLKNKDTVNYALSNPEKFLSARAIEKRKRFNIPIVYEDIPINPIYRDSLLSLDSSIHLMAQSKWMNYLVISFGDTLEMSEKILDKISEFNWVEDVFFIHQISDTLFSRWSSPGYSIPKPKLSENVSIPEDSVKNDLAYWGKSAEQINCLNGLYLHINDYRGEGMLIAVLDDGFYFVDTLSFFESFRNNHLKGIMNATPDKDLNIFRNAGSHGAKVLSIMSGNEPYSFMGSAPEADYVLIHTEVDKYENLIEEFFWVAGAEYADSIGADVVSSSLGYTDFDDDVQNHTWYDLDGRHSVASIAAEKLTEKACIVNIAAGNEGDNLWKLYSVPSDAPSVLCIAAMSTDSLIANFSSRGIKYYEKPDITSVGKGTAYCNEYDSILKGNGTSFATPLNAGLTACLWQAFPDKTAMDVMQAIRMSAHLYPHWDNCFGYGIPDYKRAYYILKGGLDLEEFCNYDSCKLYPNPAESKIIIDAENVSKIEIMDVFGRILSVSYNTNILDLSAFEAATYFLRISHGSKLSILKVVKK